MVTLLLIIQSCTNPNHCYEHEDTNLIRQGDDWILSGDTGNPATEVFAARGQDGAVSPKAPVFHRHGHVAQNVLQPLLVQTLQDVGAVHRRLKGERRHARSLERHGSRTLTLRSQNSFSEAVTSILHTVMGCTRSFVMRLESYGARFNAKMLENLFVFLL